ncbi:MAG: GntR family transcriptional regulator [Kiritimatiellae bacterium]|nr:GntR family transcriptional regulator [Kiritimatiellia bacterium]
MASKLKAQEKFLYERVCHAIEDQIRDGTLGPGARLPSETELAHTFSVHTLTVRRALRMLEKNGRLSRQHGRGTFVSGSPRQPPAVLYVGETETHVQRDIFLALGRLARDRMQTFATFDMVSPGTPTPGLDKALAGVPVVIVHSEYCEQVAPLLSRKHRLVVVGEEKRELNRPAHWVLVDRRAAIGMAVDHLAELGHRRIALVISREWSRPLDALVREEYAAYTGALASRGIRDYERIVCLRTHAEFQQQNLDKVRELMADKNPPTAFVSPSDYRARPLYLAAAALGLEIPSDFSVVGMWDTPWCTALIPELSSIDCGVEEMAMLSLILASEDNCQQMTCRVEPRLVARQSTAARRG